MYELIKGIIQKEYNTDISSVKSYNLFYETNFKETFTKINTEDIKDLNNLLLNTQISFFKENLYKRQLLIKPIITDKLNDEKDINHILYSYKRIINLKNTTRFSYKLNSTTIKNNKFILEKIIIPIESNCIIGPIMIIEINELPIELHIRGTISVTSREYGIYTPFYDREFFISNDTMIIKYKNTLYPGLLNSKFKFKNFLIFKFFNF